MTIVDKLIRESKKNAERARLGMVWNKWKWAWPKGTPDKKRRVSSPSLKRGYEKDPGPGTRLRLCECGAVAAVRKNNSHICARCDEIERRMAGEMR